ncbi:MAG: radical SAM protein [bacterium]|nr:radical SAM protein [bacterium]
MNVLVIVPNFPNRIKEYLILPSLELCIIAQILKNNFHNIDMIDMKINDYKVEDLNKLLLQKNPDIILIDDIPETHCNTKKIIKLLREKYGKKVKIGIRGELVSFEPEMIMSRNEDLDFGLRYDDDFSLLNYINNIDNLENVKNIVYRDDDNKIIVTDRQINEYDLDSLPLPYRELYDLEKYLKRDSETIVRSSRGCPGNCLFCIKTKMEKFKVFSMRRFCDEIETMQKVGFKTFFFSDDTFAFSIKRLLEFKEEIEKRNMEVKWTSNIRIKDITEEKIKLMKELGAYRVFVGIETINNNASKIIGKNLRKEEILEKIRILKDNDMEFHASFILGNPDDTEEDLENTINFVKEINPNIVTFNLIKIYPGLKLYSDPEKYGMIMADKYWFEKDEWTSKVVMGTKNLPPERLEYWSRKMLFEFIK